MSKESQNKKTANLYRAILDLKTVGEAQRFFRDLLTPEEIVEFTRRWEAAQLLNAGCTYATIVKQTGLSSRTVARISKWLCRGCGGYKLILSRQHHQVRRPSG
ncbi:hypothetical protein KKF05_00795 [Patescibacteria group bacterium]|nr:hypothetical protein [Patescibacteria group bacterium]MBU1916118.1 hypothetical protein [Patescibacteria group bacterium]